MIMRRKEHSNEFRELVIKHFLNDDVKHEISKTKCYGCVARKRPYMNKASRIKRLNYVKIYENKDMNFWKRVL